MKRVRKALSALLALALVLGFLPWAVLPARAENAPVAETNVASWEDLLKNATVTIAAGVTTVTLETCVSTTATLTVTENVVLDLNGFGIRYAGDENASVVTVAKGAALTLKDGDTSGSKKYLIIRTDYSTGRATSVRYDDATSAISMLDIQVTGGYLTGGTGTVGEVYSRGGGLDVNGAFQMRGGTIVGNTAEDTGGVYVADEAAFEMIDGSILNNKAVELAAGGVSVNGTFTMRGGTIANNTTEDSGGGVYVNISSHFSMEGGAITGNTAKLNGGGVHVRENAVFTMTGGTITENTAEKNGSGVYVRYLKKYNEIGTFNISGSPVISGNTKSGAANNVYLPNAAVKLNVTDALTEGANIGVTAHPGDTVAQIGDPRTNALSETELGYFHSDDTSLVLMLNGKGKIVLSYVPSVQGGVVYAPEDTVLIVASYDKDGRMTSVRSVAAPEGGWDGVSVADIASDADFTLPTRYKLMLVDGTTFAPLCAAWEKNA